MQYDYFVLYVHDFYFTCLHAIVICKIFKIQICRANSLGFVFIDLRTMQRDFDFQFDSGGLPLRPQGLEMGEVF